MEYFRKLAAERYGLPLSVISPWLAYKTKSDFYKILRKVEANELARQV